MRRTNRIGLVVFALFMGTAAQAAIPQTLHYSGRLNTAGGAFTGTIEVAFALYAGQGAKSSFWSETQAVAAQNGRFHVQLGSKTTLSAADVDVEALHLGVTVAGDAEMERVPIASVPYALRADEAGNAQRLNGQAPAFYTVPSGMIGFFVADCPPGWTEFTTAQGRAIVGLPAGGQSGATVGDALAAGGLLTIDTVATHAHTGAAHSHDGAAHSHDGSAHEHSLSGSTSSGGSHSHGGGATIKYVGSGCCETGLSVTSTSTAGDHSHSLSGIASSGGGGKTGLATPAPGGATTPAQGGPTGEAAVDVTMPYIQLKACQAL
jgi:hypothetical protein